MTTTLAAPTRTASQAPARTTAGWTTQTWEVFRRWMTNTLREPWGIAISLLQPAIWILLFGGVFSALGTIPGLGDQGYRTFLVPGILMMTVLYSGAWAGNGYLTDMERGIMDRLLTSPLRRSAMVAGQLAQQLLVALVQGVVVLAIGWLAGARYAGGLGGLALALGVSLLLGVIFCSFSCAIALTTASQVALIGIAQAVVLPVTFLSTTMMARDLMPSWAGAIAQFNPLSWAVDTARAAMSGTFDWGYIALRCGLLAVLAAAAFAWTLTAFSTYRKRL